MLDSNTLKRTGASRWVTFQSAKTGAFACFNIAQIGQLHGGQVAEGDPFEGLSFLVVCANGPTKVSTYYFESEKCMTEVVRWITRGYSETRTFAVASFQEGAYR